MKIPYSWLTEFVKLDVDAQTCADALSLAGLEVEGVENIGHELSHIITGKITKIEPHPNADKLVICQVTDGKNNHQIVTGANNISEGDIIPVSLPGATLTNGLKIKSSELRGIPSNGMLCSEKELGISEEAEGIWVLPAETPIGIDFISYASLKDSILDISILPNRGDCQSLRGVARECSIIFDTPLIEPDTSYTTTSLNNPFNISVKAPDACALYTGSYLEVETVPETPFQLKRKLQLSGIRPINLLVDITNLVLIEYGQPLHSFDANALSSKKITVRYANDNELITTLDETKHTLKNTDLLICDNETPVALGGVMGGLNSEIKQHSTAVFLESAFFNPVTIRRTAFRLANRSESSMRFEKHVDPNGVKLARDRALHLYQTLANATISSTLLEEKSPSLPTAKPLPYNPEAINSLLGASISEDTLNRLFSKLGFTIEKDSITPPSWRLHDIATTACLAEEAARIYGYDKLPSSLPETFILPKDEDPIHQLISDLRNSLIHQGLNEIISFPLVSNADNEALNKPEENRWTLLNPISQDQSTLRQSLMSSLLNCLSFNQKRQQPATAIFEIGKTYKKDKDTAIETLLISGLISGERLQHNWTKTQETHPIFQLQGLMFNLLQPLSLPNVTLSRSAHPDLHPTLQVEFKCLKETIAIIGMVHPKLAKPFKYKGDCSYMEIYPENILKLPQKKSTFRPINPHPSTRRDIALTVPKNLDFNEINDYISRKKPKTVESFFLFDHFESESLGKDKKSLAIGFIYRGQNETLNDEDVNLTHTRFCNELTADLNITIRS